MELYEINPVETHDQETGQVNESILQEQVQAVEQQALIEGDLLESMKSSGGWKLVEDRLKKLIVAYTNALVREEDLEKIVRYQETVKAYKTVLEYVDLKVSKAKAYRTKQTNRTRDSG